MVTKQNLKSFAYLPKVFEYSTSFWKTLSGTPTFTTPNLVFSNATATSLASFKGGSLRMELTLVAAPAGGHSRKFGFYNIQTDECICFQVDGEIFSAIHIDKDGNSLANTITWVAGWTNTNTDFEIIWEKSTARFLVNGSELGTLTLDSSVLPLQIFISSNVVESMLLKSLVVQGAEVATATNL